MKPSTLPFDQGEPQLSAAEGHCLLVSVLMDGHARADEWPILLTQDMELGENLQSAWHRYHVIGDVLRAGPAVTELAWGGTEASLSSHGCSKFAQQVTRLAQAQGMLNEMPSVPRPTTAGSTQVAAANDGLFRWKMLSGAAACVTVVAVSWGVAGLGQGSVESTLAVAPVDRVQVAGGADALRSGPAAQPILVNTQHGQLLRDARVEELIQTHRQLGGASALHAPVGFLRTAATDANPR